MSVAKKAFVFLLCCSLISGVSFQSVSAQSVATQKEESIPFVQENGEIITFESINDYLLFKQNKQGIANPQAMAKAPCLPGDLGYPGC